jgi:phosphoribosylamine--glycine ligase
MLRSAAEGSLELPNRDFSNIGYSAVSVCLAAEGYPAKPVKGTVIKGLGPEQFDKEYAGLSIQRAGVAEKDGHYVTSGGRVLYVTGEGLDFDTSRKRAYSAIQSRIRFDGMQYRTDIGWQAQDK